MKSKSIVITGCSSGFGRCTALVLAMHGWQVFATVRREDDRAALLAEAEQHNCLEQLTVLLCDITDAQQVTQCAQEVNRLLATSSSTTPSLTALLNNAGTAYAGPLEMLSIADLRAQFELNVFAQMAVTQAFLPLLKAAQGTIINVSSISGRLSLPVIGAYAASKYALEALSDALRLELARYGVYVVIIEPASSPTGIWRSSLQRSLMDMQQHPLAESYQDLLYLGKKTAMASSKAGFPTQKFAQLVLKILECKHPRARYAIPASATFLIGLRRFLPDSLWDQIIRWRMKI